MRHTRFNNQHLQVFNEVFQLYSSAPATLREAPDDLKLSGPLCFSFAIISRSSSDSSLVDVEGDDPVNYSCS